LTVASAVTKFLAGTTGANAARLYQMGKDDALPAGEWPLAQIIEHLDSVICPLCRSIHGMIVRKGTPEYERWRLPSHINCRRIMADIHRDEVGPDGQPTRPDFVAPPQELIDKHGHFVNDPVKYAPLRVPARPTGRDFIFSKKAGQPGQLIFARAIPDRLLQETLRAIADPLIAGALVTATPVADAAILRQCTQQAANRRWFENLDSDYVAHAGAWGRSEFLSRDEYQQLPDAILQSNPSVATLRYAAAKRKQAVPMVLFRAAEAHLGDRRIPGASVLWEPATSKLWHAGRLDAAALEAEQDFKALTGWER